MVLQQGLAILKSAIRVKLRFVDLFPCDQVKE
jgi:hypothetical protein